MLGDARGLELLLGDGNAVVDVHYFAGDEVGCNLPNLINGLGRIQIEISNCLLIHSLPQLVVLLLHGHLVDVITALSEL